MAIVTLGHNGKNLYYSKMVSNVSLFLMAVIIASTQASDGFERDDGFYRQPFRGFGQPGFNQPFFNPLNQGFFGGAGRFLGGAPGFLGGAPGFGGNPFFGGNQFFGRGRGGFDTRRK
ncbi:hypothetical protein LOTGIDRAFT_232497 [Lottia gigantea]|uniref:Uncharacterized protein n=1 Tax=Lottia gigantea TaxID=225164 RepID=V4ABR4_LOTGI|nr:hypothetical protein LOTGIDRAFT_232497 [Lottia gigantea]ESO94257.1 hypothetical protein LOTGIDRAFT_232497 [Lottia gigantea]